MDFSSKIAFIKSHGFEVSTENLDWNQLLVLGTQWDSKTGIYDNSLLTFENDGIYEDIFQENNGTYVGSGKYETLRDFLGY